MDSSVRCKVFSPCGRYAVQMQSDGRSTLQITIDRQESAATTTSTSAHDMTRYYSASLREAEVVELTTAAGVRKSFEGFVKMVYHALIGCSRCVRFFVENVYEMRERLAKDLRRQGKQVASDEGSKPAKAEDGGSELSINVDRLSPEALEQLFFTIDYEVDFTRAVYPVPLEPVPLAEVLSTSQQHGAKMSGDGRGAEGRDAQHVEPNDAREMIDSLRAENHRLAQENAALTRLSREKMGEMQRLCSDFQNKVHVEAEVERLRAKCAALRLQLREAEKAKDSAIEALREERLRQGSAAPRANNNRGPRERLTSPRGVRTAKGVGSRFDTPPHGVPRRAGSQERGRHMDGRRPPSARSRSNSSERPRSVDSCSSRRSSLSATHERLYRTPTASSQHRREVTQRELLRSSDTGRLTVYR